MPQREGDVARQLMQQAHLLFIEEIGGAGVKRERAFRLVVVAEREHDLGFAAFFARARNAL